MLKSTSRTCMILAEKQKADCSSLILVFASFGVCVCVCVCVYVTGGLISSCNDGFLFCLLFFFPFFLGRDKFLVYLPFETLPDLTNLSAYPHLPLITVSSSQCSPMMTTAESKPSASFHVYPHSQQHDII